MITQARKPGYSVPQDIAVLGCDDIREAQRVTPALTTVARRPKEIGARLTELLFDRIEDRETGPARKVQVAYELVVRESA